MRSRRERIIRNEKELSRMREYIYNISFNWDEDSLRETDDLIGLFEDNKSS